MLLQGLKWSTCLCYLDDVMVFSAILTKHLECLSTILVIYRQAGIKLNSSKYHFTLQQITVLGHLVDTSSVRPDQKKIRAVTNICVSFTTNRHLGT